MTMGKSKRQRLNDGEMDTFRKHVIFVSRKAHKFFKNQMNRRLRRKAKKEALKEE